MSDYDAIVVGGGSPGEHCAGELARRRPARRAGRAGPGRRLVLLLGVHPVQTLLRPGEAAHDVNEAAATARRPP